jgi:hypothetical protein
VCYVSVYLLTAPWQVSLDGQKYKEKHGKPFCQQCFGLVRRPTLFLSPLTTLV